MPRDDGSVHVRRDRYWCMWTSRICSRRECRERHHDLAVETAGRRRAGPEHPAGWSRRSRSRRRSPKPSISTRSWFSVCSRSSLPPPRPRRAGGRPSISSMNTMQGAFFFACSNMSHARGADAHEHLDEVGARSEERDLGLAGDRAGKQRLAVPGRPPSHAARDAPAQLLEFRRSRRKSTSSPPLPWPRPRPQRRRTSPGSVLVASAQPCRTRTRRRPPPCIWRMKKIHTPSASIGTTTRRCSQEGGPPGLGLDHTLFFIGRRPSTDPGCRGCRRCSSCRRGGRLERARAVELHL